MNTMAVDFKKLFDDLSKSPDGVVRIADHSSYSSDGATYLVEIRKELPTESATTYGTLAGS